jgi:hypothetical protein
LQLHHKLKREEAALTGKRIAEGGIVVLQQLPPVAIRRSAGGFSTAQTPRPV